MMFTCFIRYVVDPNKLKEFEEYARTWIKLIEKHGGTHHGYFLPEKNSDNLPNPSFSFSDIGKEGANNIAVALFSFPDKETYDTYKRNVSADEECKIATEKFKASKCFLSYERSFLKPIFE